MGYDGPEIFLAPFGNDAALENFERTAIEGVDPGRIEQFTDREFAENPVRLWGTKESLETTWSNVDRGDFLLFYRSGTYEYAAEVRGTEKNAELGKDIWPNYEEGSPWVCIIYLDEPVELGVDSSIVHGLAGYDIDYPMGFSPLNEMGIGGIRGKYGSVEEFVYGSEAGPEESAIDVSTAPYVEVPESALDGLYFPDEQAAEIVDQVNSSLNAGKHLILTGPPGTGKTEIARRVCKHLVEEHDDVYSGYQMTTATADWSTFETVGGYMPEEGGNGDLSFEPGQILRRFKRGGTQRNEPLVIDEINRADIDKSFGQLFTLLSGQGVQLPFKRDGEEIEVLPAGDVEGEPAPNQYLMPESWRILATMNSYDKTSLYEMSYAFMRRFAFIHVDAPDVPEGREAELVARYADAWGIDASEETLRGIGEVWRATNSVVEERKIGPAIVKDALTHVVNSRADRTTALTQAVTDYVFPQLEGVPRREKIVAELARLDAVDSSRLRQLGRDMLQVRITEGE